MKIAIVTHNVVRGDGQGRVLSELAKYALLGGYAVELVADRVDRSLEDLGAHVTRISPILRRPILPKVWSFARQADRIVSNLQSQGYLVVGNGFSLREPHEVNIAHMVHDEWLRVLKQQGAAPRGCRGAYQKFYTRCNVVWEKQAFAAARCVVAVSEQVRESLIRVGVEADRIKVITNGVDLDEFHPGNEPRRALGLPDGAPLALFVGDIRSPLKNLQLVLNALTRIESLHLAVVGDRQGSPYPAMATRLQLAGRVHFLGFRNDIPRLMRAADFCVFPSFCDAFGLVILEAMASGLPVIASRAAGASQLVTSECGILIDSADESGLIAAMSRLVANPCDRAAMGAAARRVAESHSWRLMAEKYLALFRAMSATSVDSAPSPAAVGESISAGDQL